MDGLVLAPGGVVVGGGGGDDGLSISIYIIY